MVDILKITAPTANKKIQNTPKHPTTETLFDLENPKIPSEKRTEQKDSKQSVLNNLNREILKPLFNELNTQSLAMKKIVLMATLFDQSANTISEEFLSKMFLEPGELFDELLAREKAETIFKGVAFDTLRDLAKMEGQPTIKEAILNVLKYFECTVNKETSQELIRIQSVLLAEHTATDDSQVLNEYRDKLDGYIRKEDFKAVNHFLKDQFIPLLGDMAKKYQGNEKIGTLLLSLVHRVVRHDKADPEHLEQAILRLGEELEALGRLSDDDIREMKKDLFEQIKIARDLLAKDSRETKELDKLGRDVEKADMAALLSKGLDKEGPVKISNAAQSLLLHLLRSESPVMSLMHYMIPIRYLNENTYGEFFIDKDGGSETKDEKKPRNILFTIQSDKYGDFEVDLKESGKKIDLNIKCSDLFVDSVKEEKQKLKAIIEEQGYLLSNLDVGVYREGTSIIQRFPKLANRKVGLDVKI